MTFAPAAPLVLRGRLVLPDVVVEDGVLVLEADRITYAGAASSAPLAVLPDAVEGVLLLPGLVDVHNHGGGGASLPDATSAEQVRTAVREHLSQGTTTMLASLVTAGRETLVARAELLGALAEAGEIAGIHAEGPFLSYERRGAQSPEHLVPGEPGLVRDLVAASGGHLRSMTVAPEVPGVAGPGGAAEALVAAGAVPSLGHTSGTAEQADALIAQVAPALRERGLEMTATHLFNGMPPLHHRAPGPVAACLAAAARGDLVAELVADGVHLAPATIRSVVEMVGADRVALVTDAMAAAGMPDGDYVLGPMAVTVAGGVARLTDGGSIAGGTSRLLDVVRTTVGAGVPLADAVRSASWVPARALGLADVGGLVAGRRADVLVTDASLRPVRVLRGGADIG
ncbi:N-acetylglucosamine-6-phosphate deacetylase [Xylanimonas cellulosilytica DSM 15894]|uniref:N-acetylglucosamine-6-phosphate deacetylase n=1 Tax=Xylanimonas cellulosilytica (strain DSM 15894 / JCM 12276 / CECT 5975 / KCTC 9989 / LMG 20990 / NBRC 107835 / XIL07) TaxID=446471 RepID=D1BWB2_XYLCX|nr:amidohydrolase family protein [Xylanimonas cellulosilytica]ACZ31457.1 N-acetylglucosamine-6-phosphate deacetylase [Xylanimonas cellulosilytica DSM 15894]